jgi:hypothetical protein
MIRIVLVLILSFFSYHSIAQYGFVKKLSDSSLYHYPMHLDKISDSSMLLVSNVFFDTLVPVGNLIHKRFGGYLKLQQIDTLGSVKKEVKIEIANLLFNTDMVLKHKEFYYAIGYLDSIRHFELPIHNFVIVTKFDKDGIVYWQKTIGDTIHKYQPDQAVFHKDELYIVGRRDSIEDVQIIKLDTSGNMIFHHSIPFIHTLYDKMTRCIFPLNDTVIYIFGAGNKSPGVIRYWDIRINTQGDTLSTQEVSNPTNLGYITGYLGQDSFMYIHGFTLQKFDLQGNFISNTNYAPHISTIYNSQKIHNNERLLIGTTNLLDHAIVAVDSNYQMLWQEKIDVDNTLDISYFAIKLHNSYYIAGMSFYNGLKPWLCLMKLNSMGKLEYPLDLPNLEEKGLASFIYPNPTSSDIYIYTHVPIRHTELIDMAGKRLIHYLENNRIQMAHLPSGTYFLTLHTETGKQTIPFQKK